jgi:hypothetical protein
MTAENNCLETLAQWRFWWLPQKHKEGKKSLSSQTQSSWSGHIDKWWKQIQQYQIGQFYSVRKLFIKVLLFNRFLRWWGDTKVTTIVCIKLQLFSYSVGYCTSHWHGTWTKTESFIPSLSEWVQWGQRQYWASNLITHFQAHYCYHDCTDILELHDSNLVNYGLR